MPTKKETAGAAPTPEVKKKAGRKLISDTEKENTSAAPAPEVKKKTGRKPMTEAEKEIAKKARAQEKAKADNLKPEFILQYQGSDIDLAALAEAAKADFHQAKKRTLITDLKLYVKPEEHTVYYVVNGNITGSVVY